MRLTFYGGVTMVVSSVLIMGHLARKSRHTKSMSRVAKGNESNTSMITQSHRI